MLMHVVQLILTSLSVSCSAEDERRKHFIVSLNFFVFYIKNLNVETLSNVGALTLYHYMTNSLVGFGWESILAWRKVAKCNTYTTNKSHFEDLINK